MLQHARQCMESRNLVWFRERDVINPTYQRSLFLSSIIPNVLVRVNFLRQLRQNTKLTGSGDQSTKLNWYIQNPRPKIQDPRANPKSKIQNTRSKSKIQNPSLGRLQMKTTKVFKIQNPRLIAKQHKTGIPGALYCWLHARQYNGHSITFFSYAECITKTVWPCTTK